MSEYSYEIVSSRSEQPIEPGCTVLDGWEIVRKIGEGSQAKVYEIRSTGLTELRCALKVIDIPQNDAELQALQERSVSESHLQRELEERVTHVQREVRAMAAIHDEPASVRLEDCRLYRFEEDGTWRVLIRMELLTPLPAYAKQHPLNPADVWRLAEEIGGLLAVCRQEGILHRDIKPGNLFVTGRGRFKLGDFGLARASGSVSSDLSNRVGTESYMAPEVYSAPDEAGGRYDHRADLYSLALVLYQYLNGGFLPFESESTTRRQAFLLRIRGTDIPALPNAAPEVNAFFRKALAYRPDDRFPNPEVFLDALADIKKGLQPVRKKTAPGAPVRQDLITRLQTFRPSLQSGGYKPSEVDAFCARIAAVLAASTESMETIKTIEEELFTLSKRGYDKLETDRFLDDVCDGIEKLLLRKPYRAQSFFDEKKKQEILSMLQAPVLRTAVMGYSRAEVDAYLQELYTRIRMDAIDGRTIPEIEVKQFSREKGGYHAADTDTFLDDVCDKIEVLLETKE